MICPYCSRKLSVRYGVGAPERELIPQLPAHRCRECNGTCPGGPLPTLRPRKVCTCHGPQPVETDTDPRGGCPCRLRELGEAGYCTCEDLFPPFDRTEGYCEHGGWQCVCNACGLLAESRPKPLSPFMQTLRRLRDAGLSATVSHGPREYAAGSNISIRGGRGIQFPTGQPPVYTDGFNIDGTFYGFDITRDGVKERWTAQGLPEAIDLVIALYEGKVT